MEYIDEIELSSQIEGNQKCMEQEFDVSALTRYKLQFKPFLIGNFKLEVALVMHSFI